MKENNGLFDSVNKIEQEREKARNGYEAYSRILELSEQAENAVSGLDKLVKNYWTALKEKNGSAMMAYAKELKRQAVAGAAAYISLAADAGLASDIE